MKEEKLSWIPRFHLICAIVLFFVDALYLDQGVIAFLVAFIFLLRLVCGGGLDLLTKRPLSSGNLKRFGVYFICLLVVGGVRHINNNIAHSRAESVIAAVKQFKAKYHAYPPKLEALVPEFLPAVPAAKLNFAMSNRFYYFSMKGDATLFYQELPPFGRPTYGFESDHWGYID